MSALHIILSYHINSHTIYIYIYQGLLSNNHQVNLTARESRKRSNIIYAVCFLSQTVARDIVQTGIKTRIPQSS